MKILIVSHCQVVSRYQAEVVELAKKHDVTLITPTIYKEGASKVKAETLGKNYKHYKLRTIFGRFGKQHLHFYINFIFICRLLKKSKFDLIYVYEEPASAVTSEIMFLKKLFSNNSRIIFWSACNTPRDYEKLFRWWDIRRYLYRAFRKYCYASGDAVVAISKDVATELRRTSWHGDIYICPTHFIDENFFKYNENPPDNRGVIQIGLVGRITYPKGFDLIIRAAKQICEKNRSLNFKINIYGDGDEKSKLVAMAKDLKIESIVEFFPAYGYEKMPGIYHANNIIVVPSREYGIHKEQFGRVAIEALACGCTLVTSDVGYLPNFSTNKDLVFNVNSVEGAVESLLIAFSLCRDELVRQKNRMFIKERFSASATAERLDKVFNGACLRAKNKSDNLIEVFSE